MNKDETAAPFVDVIGGYEFTFVFPVCRVDKYD
jgi:hypothetical protein